MNTKIVLRGSREVHNFQSYREVVVKLCFIYLFGRVVGEEELEAVL